MPNTRSQTREVEFSLSDRRILVFVSVLAAGGGSPLGDISDSQYEDKKSTSVEHNTLPLFVVRDLIK